MIKEKVRSKPKKLVCGIGINDADYQLSIVKNVAIEGEKNKYKTVWKCPFYQVWISMIFRCYSKKVKSKWPRYADCWVSDEWLRFTTFKEWMEKQDWVGKQLDKDILVPGNKEYSAKHCVFVSSRVNSFMIEANTARGEWPIGVYQDKFSGNFIGICRGLDSKQVHLGTFQTPAEAHEAWRKFKLGVAKQLAMELEDFIGEALVDRYEKYENYFMQMG